MVRKGLDPGCSREQKSRHPPRGKNLAASSSNLSNCAAAAFSPEPLQDWTIFSKAGRLRMSSVDPLSCSSCFFLNSEKRRLTVSRVVPMISAISSWVSVSLTCDEPSLGVPFVDQESSNFANFSEGEVVRPRVRISSYAVE